MFGRVSVNRPHNHGPWLAYACLLAVVVSLFASIVTPVTSFYWGWRFDGNLGSSLRLACSIIVVFLVVRPDCHHVRWCFALGGLIVATTLVTLVFFAPFGVGNFSRVTILVFPFQMGSSVIVTIVVGGLLAVGMSRLTRLAFRRSLVEADPVCPGCGYDIAHLPGPRCPECGRALTASDLNPTRPSVLREWRRFAMVTLIASGLLAGSSWAFPYILVPVWLQTGLSRKAIEPLLNLSRARCAALMADYLQTGTDKQRASAVYNITWAYPYGSQRLVLLREAVSGDPSALVRRLAVQSLDSLAPDLFRELLPSILKDEDPMVRWGALAHAALGGDSADPRGTPFLIRALDDPDPTVRRYVHQRLLNNTGKSSLPFDPYAPREQRLADQAAWQAWWDNQSNADQE